MWRVVEITSLAIIGNARKWSDEKLRSEWASYVRSLVIANRWCEHMNNFEDRLRLVHTWIRP